MSYFNIILPDLNDFSINPSFSRYVMCDSVSPIPKYFFKGSINSNGCIEFPFYS